MWGQLLWWAFAGVWFAFIASAAWTPRRPSATLDEDRARLGLRVLQHELEREKAKIDVRVRAEVPHAAHLEFGMRAHISTDALTSGALDRPAAPTAAEHADVQRRVRSAVQRAGFGVAQRRRTR